MYSMEPQNDSVDSRCLLKILVDYKGFLLMTQQSASLVTATQGIARLVAPKWTEYLGMDFLSFTFAVILNIGHDGCLTNSLLFIIHNLASCSLQYILNL